MKPRFLGPFDDALKTRLERLTQVLEQVIGCTHNVVTPEWRLENDENRRESIVLALSDFTGARVQARFARHELDHTELMRMRFYSVWGDLLQARSHQQLDVLSGKTEPAGR